MTDKPDIAIIIPTYNHGKFIVDAVQSVLDQDFKNFEIIVVDDGSTDNTKDIVSQLTDTRVKYFYQQNKGLPAARNTGIKFSAAEYITFLDADDQYCQGKLSKQRNFLNLYVDVDLCYSGCYEVNENFEKVSIRLPGTDVQTLDLLKGFPFTVNDVMVKKKVLEANNYFDESFVLNSEDFDLWLRLSLAGCIMRAIPQLLSLRQVHNNRVFRNLEKKLEVALQPIKNTIGDERFPKEIKGYKDGFANVYLPYLLQAFFQGEFSLGQLWIKEWLKIKKSNNIRLVNNEIINSCLHLSVRYAEDFEKPIENFFNNLPIEAFHLKGFCKTTIDHAYILKALQHLQWERMDLAGQFFQEAAKRKAKCNSWLFEYTLNQIIGFDEAGFKAESIHFFKNVSESIKKYKLSMIYPFDEISGIYYFNKALSLKNQKLLPGSRNIKEYSVLAVKNNPSLLLNRGMQSLLFKSFFGEIIR